MNNNDLLYEVTLDKDSKLIIITYAIKYSNCDFIHAVQVKPFIRSNYTKIFESKNLDNFVNIGYYDNPIIKTYGFTKKKELAELYKEKYEKLIKFNYFDNLISDKIETIDYYKTKEFKLKEEIETLNAKINSFN